MIIYNIKLRILTLIQSSSLNVFSSFTCTRVCGGGVFSSMHFNHICSFCIHHHSQHADTFHHRKGPLCYPFIATYFHLSLSPQEPIFKASFTDYFGFIIWDCVYNCISVASFLAFYVLNKKFKVCLRGKSVLWVFFWMPSLHIIFLKLTPTKRNQDFIDCCYIVIQAVVNLQEPSMEK